MFFSGTDLSPFVPSAELDYRNSYEIEYMEKIGSSLPVSFPPSSQSDTRFPTLSFVMKTQQGPPPMHKASRETQTSNPGPPVPAVSWGHHEGELGLGL